MTFEARWRQWSPGSHRAFRQIYNRLGPAIAARIDSPWIADAIFLALTPLQWILGTLKMHYAESMPTAAASDAEGDSDITGLLHRFQQGDAQAKELLVTKVYSELKIIAARYMRREKEDHTLQTTALVNEAYMKLVNVKDAQWNDRSHFFAVAAQMMRRILVDHARENIAEKRGGGHGVLQLDEALVFAPAKSQDMVRLDDALTRLEASDPRAAKVVELRFFGGLSIEETAEAMDVSPRTVKREWTFAKAWLRNELGVVTAGDDSVS